MRFWPWFRPERGGRCRGAYSALPEPGARCSRRAQGHEQPDAGGYGRWRPVASGYCAQGAMATWATWRWVPEAVAPVAPVSLVNPCRQWRRYPCRAVYWLLVPLAAVRTEPGGYGHQSHQRDRASGFRLPAPRHLDERRAASPNPRERPLKFH
jgi:hypothetical protein